MKKVLIFDFDGTLADTIPNNKAIAIMFNTFAEKEKLSHRISEKDVKKFRQEHLFSIITYLKIPLWRLPFLVRKIQKSLKKDIITAEPFDGMREVLQTLKDQGSMLGIVSTSQKQTIEAFLTRHKLTYFDFVYTSKNIFGKHTVLKKIIKKHALHNANIFYVGDEIRDIDAAKKVGIPIIAVTWGFNSKSALQKQHPFALIETPKELLSVIS